MTALTAGRTSLLDVPAVREQAVATMCALWLAGAGVAGLYLLLPHSETTDEVAIAILGGVAVAGSLATFALRRLIPNWFIFGAAATGSVLIALSIYFGGDPAASNALLLVWPVIYAAYYFRRSELIGLLVLIGIAYGAALAFHPNSVGAEPFAAQWLTGTVSLAVAGLLISHLIGQRRAAERMRRQLAELVEASNDAIIGTSVNGVIQTWNRGAAELLGYSVDDAVGRPLSWVAPGDARTDIEALFEALRQGAEITDHEVIALRQDAQKLVVRLTASPVTNADGMMTGVSIIAHDVSEQKHLEEVSERLLAESEARARTDALTGLANRRAWDEELRREIARAGRQGWPVCIAMLDLDHFKSFNDEQGHLAGDELLKESAAIWRVVLRDDDFVARYGGEEFCVLLPNCSTGDAVTIVERLRAATPMGQTCSAGIATWDGSESAAELLRRADGALYSAKRAGRNRLTTA